MDKKNKITLSLSGAAVSIIAAVFALEGGFTNNPKDPGGATNFGITEGVARSHGYSGSMQDLPRELAEQIYYLDYVQKPNYHLIIELSPAVGRKLVDAGVNAGTHRSSRWFQNSLNALNRGGLDYPHIASDGSIGPRTIEAYKSLQLVRGAVKACELVIKLMDAQQASHYLSLTHLNTFTVGWIDHRIGNVSLTECGET